MHLVGEKDRCQPIVRRADRDCVPRGHVWRSISGGKECREHVEAVAKQDGIEQPTVHQIAEGAQDRAATIHGTPQGAGQREDRL